MKAFDLAFCNHYNVATGVFTENILVKILELTHEKSAVSRAKVMYSDEEEDYVFTVPRSQLKLAKVMESLTILYLCSKDIEYNIIAEAVFYVNPKTKVITKDNTPYKIKYIKVNGHKWKCIDSLCSSIGKPYLKDMILEDLVASLAETQTEN